MVRHKKDKLRGQFFFSYLLMLVIPMLATTIVYNMAYRLVEKRELEMHTLLVNDCMVQMDQSMLHIDNTIIDMMRNPSLNKLLLLRNQPQYSSQDASLVYTVYDELTTYTNFANIDADLVIYMHGPDLVFDGKSIVYGQENFYEIALSYQGLPYESFKEAILDSYHYRDVIGNMVFEKKKSATSTSTYATKSGFLYVQTLPLVGGRTSPLGTAIIHVDSKLDEVLNLVPHNGLGSTYITDEDQNLIAGMKTGEPMATAPALPLTGSKGAFYQQVDGQRMLISYVRSDYNGWYYISMSPMNQIMAELKSFQISVIAISVLVVLVSILFSLYFSRKNSRPLEEVLMEIRNSYGQESSSLGSLGTDIHSILAENTELQNTLERQKLLGRSNFYDSLFRGGFGSEEEILTNADYLGFDLSAAGYCVMVLCYEWPRIPDNEDKYLQTDLARILTKHLSLKQAGFRSFTYPLSDSRLGVLLCFDGDREEENKNLIDSFVRQMIEQQDNHFSHGIRCYVGGFVTKLTDLCISFGEADSVCELQRGDASGRQLLYYRDIGVKKRGYFFPDEIRKRLGILASTGDNTRLQEVLDYIYGENQARLSVDKQMAYVLLVELYTTLVKITNDMGVDFFPQRLYQIRAGSFQFELEFDLIRESFAQLAGAASPAGQEEQSLMDRMEQFIRDNLASQEMSIPWVAGHFHISETYFSQFFKRNTGQTFSKYLETLRINKACGLLRETDKSMDTIAAETGYSSPLSFRRAFKKVMGKTPSAFRETSA